VQDLYGQSVDEGGESKGEILCVYRLEDAYSLAVSNDIGNDRSPSTIQRFALARSLGVAASPSPELNPERPVILVTIGAIVGARPFYERHQTLERIGDTGQLVERVEVKPVFGKGERLCQQPVLGLEVVEEEAGTQAGSFGDIGNARVAKPALTNDLDGRLQRLKTPLLCQFGAGHFPLL
jgi:hypothetical protein